ncbi:MAG: hypothetical protein WBV71_16440 [Roseobacter sp.]
MATLPIFWVPKFNEFEPKGFEVKKNNVWKTPAKAIEALGKIGLTVTPQGTKRAEQAKSDARLPTSAATSTAIALLDQPAGEPFTKADQAIISNYLGKFGQYLDNPLPDLHREVVARIFVEHRFEEPSNLANFLHGDARLRARVLPVAMDAFEAGEPISGSTTSAIYRALRDVLTSGSLSPHYEQYARILANLPEDASVHWYALIGRFGRDPRPLLSSAGLTGTARLEASLVAFCHSEQDWEAPLAEALWQNVQSNVDIANQGGWVSQPIEDALKALAWAGYRSEIDRWITTLDLKDYGIERHTRRMNAAADKSEKAEVC